MLYQCRDCGLITPARYCDVHQAERDARKKSRPNFRQRGYGAEFERNRKILLARDPVCTCPGCPSCNDRRRCTRASNTADHLKRKRGGGSDALDNLRSLCGPCHSRHTAIESPAGWNRRTTPLGTTNG